MGKFNMNIEKKIILSVTALIVIYSCSHAQTSYQNYDPLTRGVEYHVSTSQIKSNQKQVEMLKSTKDSYSVMNNSKARSQIQAVISAKEDENFRLRQKSYLLINSTRIDNVQDYNTKLEQYKAKVYQNK
jgi:uncharacterized membrane protein YhiD involved in acid resistance